MFPQARIFIWRRTASVSVESYKCYAVRKSRSIEAFGEEEPVAAVTGRTSYTLELSRVDTSPAYSDGVDF